MPKIVFTFLSLSPPLSLKADVWHIFFHKSEIFWGTDWGRRLWANDNRNKIEIGVLHLSTPPTRKVEWDLVNAMQIPTSVSLHSRIKDLILMQIFNNGGWWMVDGGWWMWYLSTYGQKEMTRTSLNTGSDSKQLQRGTRQRGSGGRFPG